MRMETNVLFNGQCKEAFQFYAKCLHGEIRAMFSFADAPVDPHVPAEWRDKIMHARMDVGEGALMGSDAPPGYYKQPQGFSVTLGLSDINEAERIFAELSEGGTVTMPMQKTFWAARFAMFTDRFGIPWIINCEDAGLHQ
jgi:PhnB protein